MKTLFAKLKTWFSQQEEIRNLHDEFSYESLASFLPFESYSSETKLFYNKTSVGFSIEFVPIVGSDPSISKELDLIFEEIMDEGSSVQFLLFSDHRIDPILTSWEKSRSNQKGIFEEITRRRIEHFKYSEHITPRIFRCVLSYSEKLEEASESDFRRIKEKREKLLKIVNTLSYGWAWEDKDFLNFLGAMINFSFDPDYFPLTYNPLEKFGEQLCCGGSLGIQQDHLSWKHKEESWFRSYRVVNYPSVWSLGLMGNLIGDLYRESYRIHTPFYLHYGIHLPNQNQAEGSFKKRMALVENQGRSKLLIRMMPKLRDELSEYDFIRSALAGSQKIVWTQFSAGLWSPKEDLEKHDQSIKSIFKLNQFGLAENRYVHLPSFLSALPMTWGEYVKDLKKLSLLKTTISSECQNLLPIQCEWMGTGRSGMLLMGRRGQLAMWNPFDNQTGNYNVVVVGRSGSGKSVFMQELLLSALSTGKRVFVIDVGRSFDKMCSAVKGQYLEFSKNINICLNPFSKIPKEDEEERQNLFAMLKSVISTMAAPTKGTSDYDNSLIEAAIKQAWKEKGNQATVTTVAWCLDKMEDVQAKIISKMLIPYCLGGIYDKYFEGENNVDFNEPMVLIELEELKEKKDLQSVVLQLFIMSITNFAFLGDRKTPFHICIDEAWDLLRGGQAGVFIETLARRLRKYNGSLVIGTQGVDDFYATPGAKAAYENSDWMCLLSQKNSSIACLRENQKIELDEAKQCALESVHTIHGKYSEVMICNGEGGYSIVRLVLDEFSELLYSTQAEEYSKIKAEQLKGKSIVEAVNEFLENRRKVQKKALV